MTIELLAPIPAQGLVYVWEDVNEVRWIINVEKQDYRDDPDIRTVLYGPLEEDVRAQRDAWLEVRAIVDATRRLTR